MIPWGKALRAPCTFSSSLGRHILPVSIALKLNVSVPFKEKFLKPLRVPLWALQGSKGYTLPFNTCLLWLQPRTYNPNPKKIELTGVGWCFRFVFTPYGSKIGQKPWIVWSLGTNMSPHKSNRDKP